MRKRICQRGNELYSLDVGRRFRPPEGRMRRVIFQKKISQAGQHFMLKSPFKRSERISCRISIKSRSTQRLRTRQVWRSSRHDYQLLRLTSFYQYDGKKFNMEPTVTRRNGALADRISAPNFYSLCTPRVATKLPDGFLIFCAVAGRGRFFPKRGTPS